MLKAGAKLKLLTFPMTDNELILWNYKKGAANFLYIPHMHSK